LKRLFQSIGLAAASLTITLLLLELAVRAVVPPQRWYFLDAAGDWLVDTGIGWVNMPDRDVKSQTPYGWVHFRTNPDGLIPYDARREKPPGSVRIMIFGDSMVIGRNVAQDEIYSAKLQEDLRARGIPADVVNAGVQGYSTDQALLLMQRWLPVYRPDFVVYGSTLNDYGGNSVPEAYGQPKPRYRIDDHGALVLSLPQGNGKVRAYGQGPRQWIQKSALYRLLQPSIFLLRSRLFGLHERILLGTEQGVYIGNRVIKALDWTLYEALVARMNATAIGDGARFVFFAHPEVGEVWEPYIQTTCQNLGVLRSDYDPFAMEKRLSAMAARRGITFLPMIESFRAAPERGPFHLLPYDAHLNAAGHAMLAEQLSERLAPLLAQPATPVQAAVAPEH
jgi:lysophospholipase L1-like esterase